MLQTAVFLACASGFDKRRSRLTLYLSTHWPRGYPVTLIPMCLIAIGQLWFFHKRGWFG